MASSDSSRGELFPDAGPRLAELARALEVLANENRLLLLRQLVRPKTVSEIDLRPETVKKGENPDRPISRQGIQLHLEKLSSIGMVATTKEPRGRALVEVHSLNYPRLFSLTEEFRALGQLRPQRETAGLVTLPGGSLPRPAQPEGPQFVIVRGLHEGTTFMLTEQNRSAQGTWLLGRKRGLAVCLEYDPYVSAENTEITRPGDGAVSARALKASRNGTHLNWEPIPPGEERRLRHGDVVGVGRTLLLFRLP